MKQGHARSRYCLTAQHCCTLRTHKMPAELADAFRVERTPTWTQTAVPSSASPTPLGIAPLGALPLSALLALPLHGEGRRGGGRSCCFRTDGGAAALLGFCRQFPSSSIQRWNNSGRWNTRCFGSCGASVEAWNGRQRQDVMTGPVCEECEHRLSRGQSQRVQKANESAPD